MPPGTYYVRVRAKNAAGTSGPSNEVTIIVGGGGPSPCTTAPGVPTGLSVSVSGTSVTLTWSAPAGGCPPSTYGVEAGSTSGASNLASVSTNSTATSYAANDVPAGTYFVRVRAGNGSSFGSPSNEVTVVVGSTAINVSGRWIGVAPDGVTYDPRADAGCDSDLQLDLTQVGAALSGTITSKTRALNSSRCQIGDVLTTALTNGTASGTGPCRSGSMTPAVSSGLPSRALCQETG